MKLVKRNRVRSADVKRSERRETSDAVCCRRLCDGVPIIHAAALAISADLGARKSLYRLFSMYSILGLDAYSLRVLSKCMGRTLLWVGLASVQWTHTSSCRPHSILDALSDLELGLL